MDRIRQGSAANALLLSNFDMAASFPDLNAFFFTRRREGKRICCSLGIIPAAIILLILDVFDAGPWQFPQRDVAAFRSVRLPRTGL